MLVMMLVVVVMMVAQGDVLCDDLGSDYEGVLIWSCYGGDRYDHGSGCNGVLVMNVGVLVALVLMYAVLCLL